MNLRSQLNLLFVFVCTHPLWPNSTRHPSYNCEFCSCLSELHGFSGFDLLILPLWLCFTGEFVTSALWLVRGDLFHAIVFYSISSVIAVSGLIILYCDTNMISCGCGYDSCLLCVRLELYPMDPLVFFLLYCVCMWPGWSKNYNWSYCLLLLFPLWFLVWVTWSISSVYW